MKKACQSLFVLDFMTWACFSFFPLSRMKTTFNFDFKGPSRNVMLKINLFSFQPNARNKMALAILGNETIYLSEYSTKHEHIFLFNIKRNLEFKNERKNILIQVVLLLMKKGGQDLTLTHVKPSPELGPGVVRADFISSIKCKGS